MATMPSPPGRFSTTTDWPQRFDSLSANSRAPISTPLPGPNVTMSRTGRFGQVSALACPAMRSGSINSAAISAVTGPLVFTEAVIGVLPLAFELFGAEGR